MSYLASFTINNEVLVLVSKITEKIGFIKHYENLNKMPKLQKQNRIRSIYSSCAIEANTLSIENVEAIINGKNVIGPLKEILEVKNAIEAYELIDKINPFELNDLLKIHYLISKNLISNAGKLRNSEEGVFDNDQCIFIAPPAILVSELITSLFKWLNENKTSIHPLILSTVFHYELVFIHPFSDGNGRTARFFQSAILGKYYPIFYYLPLENFIKDYQTEYYKAISSSHRDGESTTFIMFMLRMINKTIDNVIDEITKHENHLNIYVKSLLSVMEKNEYMSSNEIMILLNLKSKETFRKNYLNPAISAGFVEKEFVDKPTSINQRYIKK